MLLIRLEHTIPQRKVNINVYVTDNKVKYPHKKKYLITYNNFISNIQVEGGSDGINFPDLMKV